MTSRVRTGFQVLVTGALAALAMHGHVQGAGGSGVGNHLIVLNRSQVVSEEPPARGAGPACICPAPSTRNLLKLERRSPYAPAVRPAGGASGVTLRVLGLRVQFPFEDTDDPLTTGRGQFDLRDTLTYFEDEGHNLDSAPHNRNYFTAHIRALGIYWSTVSNGRLRFDPDTTVFPVAVDGAYLMPQTLAWYGTQVEGDSSVIVDRLRQLVTDAATVAAADPVVTLSDYDAVIIFHAGADAQSDVARNTPRDPFSGFLRLEETLLLSGGTDSLREAMIMPETQIQDGRITVLNAVMAHEFGHQLGLVDLYNTNFSSSLAFATQVGNFSLMDNNGANLGAVDSIGGTLRTIHGALPVYPDAWSRAYLGFADVKTVRGTQAVAVLAAEDSGEESDSTQIWRVPISETEYYLLENRRDDLDGNGEAALRQDSLTGVILGPAHPDRLPGFPPDLTREYDFLLPGRGLLIWHIDESVAAADVVPEDDIPNNFLANTLQWDREHRFISLMEADGLQQLGGLGINVIYTGSAGDYYPSSQNDELSRSTVPPARSYTGGVTGVRLWSIRDFGFPTNLIVLNASLTGRLPGFPIYAGREPGDAGAVIITDLIQSDGEWKSPGDGRPEIFAGYKHYILGWNWDGTPLTGPATPDLVSTYDETSDTMWLHPVAIGDPSDSGWLSAPLIFPGLGTTSNLVAVARSGRVYSWFMRDFDGDSLFDQNYSVATSASPTGAPMIWQSDDNPEPRSLYVPVIGGFGAGYDVFRLETGRRSTFTANGIITDAAGRSEGEAVAVYKWQDTWWVAPLSGAKDSVVVNVGPDSLFAPVLADLDRIEDPEGYEIIVLDAAGRLHVFDQNYNYLDGYAPLELGFVPYAAPSLADIDGDGYLEILVVGDGKLHAYARNGVLLPNFPIGLGPADDRDTAGTVALAVDFGEDSYLTVVTGGSSAAVQGFRGDGVPVTDMPRPVGGPIRTPMAWAWNAPEAQAAVFVRAADGFLYAFEVPVPGAESAAAVWPMARHDDRHTSVVPVDVLGPIKPDTEFFVADRAFVYPNPARDEAIVRYWLGSDAEVTIAIYDQAGSLMIEARGPGAGGAYNEWIWPCTDAASGVYFARLNVVSRSDGEEQTVFCKMAIVQ